MAVVLVVVNLGVAPPIGPGVTPSPTSTASPSATPAGPTLAPISEATPVEQLGPSRFSSPSQGFDIPGEVLLTSSRFGLPLTFQARAWDTDVDPPSSDWCWAQTSERAIVIPYRSACATELRILWPSEVDCGSGPVELTADGFAEAVLANSALGAREHPALTQTVWAVSVLRPTAGRALFIRGTADPVSASNPDDCLIKSGDFRDELRADLETELLALDILGQLIVLRCGPGHDRATAADARNRGYQGCGGVGIEGYLQIDFGR
jgi:hypothetical protein